MKEILNNIKCFFGFHKLDENNWCDFWDEYWDETTGDEYSETGIENYCLNCKKRIRK